MTWPPNATRAEILRLLEINAHIYTEWVITRAETEAVLALLASRCPSMGELCRLNLLSRGRWECVVHGTAGGPGECTGFCPAGLAELDAVLGDIKRASDELDTWLLEEPQSFDDAENLIVSPHGRKKLLSLAMRIRAALATRGA